MQERRATTRCPYGARIQYCTSEDLLPRDGRITTISERGAGLLARESLREGDRVTLSVSLSGNGEPLTATGVVRWSGTPSGWGRWRAAGLEWLPLEETSRNRLYQFLSDEAKTASAQRSRVVARAPRAKGARKRWLLVGVLLGIAVAAFAYIEFQSLQQQNRQLAMAVGDRETIIRQRDTVITYLGHTGAQLQQELAVSQTRLAATAEEVARLDQRANLLTGEVQQLTQDVERFQQSYVQTREDRDALMQRVLDLELERAHLAQRLKSVPELRQAIHEAIETRKLALDAERRLRFQALRAADSRIDEDDNRGYVIRNGQSTFQPGQPGSPIWIRVLEPEATP